VDAGNALLFLYTTDWKQQRNDANSGGLNIYIFMGDRAEKSKRGDENQNSKQREELIVGRVGVPRSDRGFDLGCDVEKPGVCPS
jgi:hypothetical protein